MTSITPADTCVDCQDRQASLNIRSRRLCAVCFIRYVTSKILKRMESYRFKHLTSDQKRRLFLPISGGVSSLVLLQILDTQLQRQIGNRNKTAYDLVIARVVLPDTDDLSNLETEYQELARRYPLHNFLPPTPFCEVLQKDDRILQDLERLGIHAQAAESSEDCLVRVLSSATSVTTRADLESILLRRLIVAMARENDCEGVLWGHSDSRLAALALADVAKGRGGSVSSNIADGPSLHGINFNYPVRDLFKLELETYAQALPEPLIYDQDDATSKQPLSSIRNTSIDDLLSNYITSQGSKYPSIMANVVRTASKLQTRVNADSTPGCMFCIMPMTRNPESMEENQVLYQMLCYGCGRMKKDIKT